MQLRIQDGVTEIDSKFCLDIEEITEIYIPKSVKKIVEAAFSVYTGTTPFLQYIHVDKENPYFDDIDGVLVTKDRKKLIAFPGGRKGSYTVPEGIEIIGKSSFRMAFFLEEVILPKSVKTIETKAFCDCVNLKNIELGGTETIGIEAFMKCFNLNVSGGENLSVIKNKAFLKCREFPGFKLCDKVTKIGEEAFYGCDVAHLDLGRGIIEIGDKAFVGKNISISLFKEQKKLLREKIFAMNDKRKFSVSVNFKDKGRTAVLCGKIGCSNIIISDNEFDFSACDTPLKKKKPVKKASKDEIKPVLIDEIEGDAHIFNPLHLSDGLCESGFFLRWNDLVVYHLDRIEDYLKIIGSESYFGSARKITDKNSEEWKYIIKQEEIINARQGKSELFIGDHGSISKDPLEMQKHFKMRYKDFVVPDSEESLSEFFEDSFGNIFNFGHAAVYSEHEKANIGTRNRSYLNVYSKDGVKKATVKFKGYPIYVFQLDRTYYVVTQQDKTSKSPAKIRLFSFEL